jgi:amidase
MDTVGPIAADVAGLVLGMQLLDSPRFTTGDPSGLTVGRARLTGEHVNPAVDAAVDAALARAGVAVTDVTVTGWAEACTAAGTILAAEAWRADGPLLAAHPDGIGPQTAERIASGRAVTLEAETAARRLQLTWQKDLESLLTDVHVLALPVLMDVPPRVDAGPVRLNRLTIPINLAGLPALSIPIAEIDGAPIALQLVAPAYGEEMLLSLGLVIEAAVAGSIG